MAWIYLIIAAVFEIGWPLGLKLAQATQFRIGFFALAGISTTLSGFFLWLAQREIPLGTAYAVWTGIGAAGTFLIGIVVFGDPIKLLRILSFALIVVGLVGLKLSN